MLVEFLISVIQRLGLLCKFNVPPYENSVFASSNLICHLIGLPKHDMKFWITILELFDIDVTSEVTHVRNIAKTLTKYLQSCKYWLNGWSIPPIYHIYISLT